jgi:putative inorganic carbon (HCO3(-)) transporter
MQWTRISAISLALASVAVLFSIAISQILLGVALAAWLLSRPRLTLPSWWIPLALYMLWTTLSLLFSPPMARHLPQIRKMYVFAILPVGYAVLRDNVKIGEWTARVMVVVAALSSIAGIVQFIRKYFHWRALNQDFYAHYQLDRITGFKHHWMTFSGQLMLVLILLAAWLLARRSLVGWAPAALIAIALVLGFTRGAWLGCLAGAVYLLWHLPHRRLWLFGLPLLVVLGYFIAPEYVQHRVRSIVSNENDHSAAARRLMYRAGWAMIKAHPVFGIGPEGPQYEFDRYRPDAYMPIAWYGHLHSDYLQTAASRGLPALVFLIWFFALILRDLHRLAWGRLASGRLASGNGEESAWLARGAAAASVAYYIEGIFEYNFGGSEVVMMWMFIVVLGYSVRGADVC